MWYKLKRATMRVNNSRWLPAEYQEVEYIKSSGRCYIDTWYSPSWTYLKINTKFNFSSTSAQLGNTPFVYGYVQSNICFLCRNSGNGKFEVGNWNSAQVTSVSVSTWTDYEVEVIANNWTQTIDINWTTWSYSCWSDLTTWSIPLFCRYGNSQYEYFATDLIMYSFKIYSSTDTLERDLVPCYRKADSVIWMYDVVNDIFYTNSWTWTFTKWADVPNMVEKQIRPATSIWYIPQMTANTQDGFTATSSTLLNSWFQPRMAFYESQGSETIPFHSNSVGSLNRAWSEIQMPNSIIVSKLKIWARKNVNDYDLRPISAFNLLGSNDWSNWTNIYSESWLWSSWTVWEVKEWDITGQNTAYTYLKLEIQANRQYVAFDCWNVAWTVS